MQDRLQDGLQDGLQGKDIDITKVIIERVDIVIGGDHGQGAFQAGFQVVGVFAKESEIKTVIFDISLAEIVCQKDNARVLEKKLSHL